MKLSAAQMAEMGRLLDEVLPLEVRERRSWLDKLDPRHAHLEPALRRALFGASALPSAEGGLLTLPKIGAPEDREPARSVFAAGHRIGPYELIRRLGAGGMAEVWLARRADGAFKRNVALKLPLFTLLRQDLAQRFARERDILASLEHPLIARLYDAGISADGMPFLAMEFVAGEPIGAWCDSRRLGIRARLETLLQVLDALQYAHGRQVIHRDIKPSNILVTESGEVRLLDFGVAKLLDDAPDDAAHLTQLFGRALTPEYASPEQLRGEPVSNSSDIYSAGVLLFELLCGNRPYGLARGSSIYLREQAMATDLLEPPSTLTTSEHAQVCKQSVAGLSRMLRGDLDAIACKALAHNPAQRYTSAKAFADDVRSYLVGRPVSARPPLASYRLAKFVFRHRPLIAVASAVLVGAILVAAVGGVTGWNHDEALEFAASLDPAKLPVPLRDRSIAVLPLLDLSEKKDQQFLAEGLSEEIIGRLAQSPRIKVISRTSSFQSRDKTEDVRLIGRKLGVAHVLEGSLRRVGNALRISVQLVNAIDGSQIWSQTYAGNVEDIFTLEDRISEAVAGALNVGLNLLEGGVPRKEPDMRAYNLLLQGNFVGSRFNTADQTKAADLYEAATRLDPSYALAWARLGAAYNRLVPVSTEPKPQLAKARLALNRALQLDPKLGLAHYVLCSIDLSEFDWAGARQELAALRSVEPDTSWRVRRLQADLTSVFGDLRDAIPLYQQVVRTDPWDAILFGELAFSLYNLGRYRDAAAAGRRLIELDPTMADSHAILGLSLLADGKSAEAFAAIEKEPDEAARLNRLAIACWLAGRHGDSNRILLEFESKFGTQMPYLLAEARAIRGEIDRAQDALEIAWAQGDGNILDIRNDRMLLNLQGRPRFALLLEKMKLAGPNALALQ